jgi:hypothetical protein
LKGSTGVGVKIESYGKVENSYINVDNFYMNNDRDIKFDIVIGHHKRSNSAFSKFRDVCHFQNGCQNMV